MKTPGSKSIIKILFLLPCILMLHSYTLSAILPSRGLTEETWKFSGKDTLSLETMGKTKVFITCSNSGEVLVKLKYEFKPDEEFEVKETQSAIYLKENILNYDSNRPAQTYFEECTWTILVPQGMYITCTGSSGEFEVNGFIGTLKASIASGIFVFNNFDGAIDLSHAMVKAKIHNSKGSFNISSATGYIRAKKLTVSGNSNFSTGQGNIKISLAREPEADLYVGSSFNRAQVNFNGHPLAGCFEFICRADEEKIISPFDLKKKRPFWMIY